MTEDEADALFHALSHSVRRRILDLVGQEPGINVGQLAGHFDVSRIAIMNHLAVLEAARLIMSERAGTSRLLYMNTTPIRAIYERWTSEFSGQWASHLLNIKRVAEATAAKEKIDNGRD